MSRRLLTAAALLMGVAVGACDDGAVVVRGIVIEVEQSSVAHVEAFTLRTASGEILHFVLGDLPSGGGSFPALHLREHLASASPVAVRYVVKDARLTVQRLADAP
jgi:hypothetical protein